MQHTSTHTVAARRTPMPRPTTGPPPARVGAPVWVLLVGLALLVLAVGPQLVAPSATTPVAPAATAGR